MNSDQSAFQRRFTKEIARISEVDRKVAQMEAMLIANEVPYIKMEDAPLEEKEAPIDVLDRVEVCAAATHTPIYVLSAIVSCFGSLFLSLLALPALHLVDLGRFRRELSALFLNFRSCPRMHTYPIHHSAPPPSLSLAL